VDVLRQRHQEPGLFSWWDYRAGNFHRHLGMRIDLLYASAPLAERLSWVVIDRNARKGKLPSDHAPVVAEFASETTDGRATSGADQQAAGDRSRREVGSGDEAGPDLGKG
nr:hypothetical protein [Actinomycetota bacterium]